MWRNHIGDAGAAELAQMLVVNTTLRILSLDGNVVGDQGTKRFSKAWVKWAMGMFRERLLLVLDCVTRQLIWFWLSSWGLFLASPFA